MSPTAPRRAHAPQTLAGLPWLSTLVVGVALAALAAPAAAPAQTRAAVAAPPASQPAPPATRAAPRRLSTTELRDSATAPGELRPERRVVPQIVIPIGRGAPAAAAPAARARRTDPAPPAAAIDDRAARCEALPGSAARARCHDRLAHQAAQH